MRVWIFTVAALLAAPAVPAQEKAEKKEEKKEAPQAAKKDERKDVPPGDIPQDPLAVKVLELIAREAPIEPRLREAEPAGKGPGVRRPPPPRAADESAAWGYPWYPPYYPWWPLPQSHITKQYPPSIVHTPRLGLQHTYLGALQMGIRVPDDSDPLHVEPNLGPFVGIVGAAKAELAAAEAAARGDADDDGAIGLMREGKFKEAGRLLAGGLERSDDPRTLLLLSEVFFALGKPKHAEILLQQALATEDVDELKAALPRDVAKHFPTPEMFEMKLQDLVSAGEYRLLGGYLGVHSKDPTRGLETLQDLSRSDKGAGILYRHYLGKAFKE